VTGNERITLNGVHRILQIGKVIGNKEIGMAWSGNLPADKGGWRQKESALSVLLHMTGQRIYTQNCNVKTAEIAGPQRQ